MGNVVLNKTESWALLFIYLDMAGTEFNIPSLFRIPPAGQVDATLFPPFKYCPLLLSLSHTTISLSSQSSSCEGLVSGMVFLKKMIAAQGFWLASITYIKARFRLLRLFLRPNFR